MQSSARAATIVVTSKTDESTRALDCQSCHWWQHLLVASIVVEGLAFTQLQQLLFQYISFEPKCFNRMGNPWQDIAVHVALQKMKQVLLTAIGSKKKTHSPSTKTNYCTHTNADNKTHNSIACCAAQSSLKNTLQSQKNIFLASRIG